MTPLMHLYVLASGSAGNAAVIDGPDGAILIDCGISRKELGRRAADAGANLDRVQAVFVTHEHGDHVRGIPVLASHTECPFYATAGTAGGGKALLDVPFTLVSHDDEVDVGGMHVTLFPTSHDVADPFGMRVEVRDDGGATLDAIGWCTDTGFLTAEALGALRDVRILGIESNHDVEMLRNGPYPAFLRRRVGGEAGHLSNKQCADALSLLVGDDTETVVALHLSEKNNRPSVCMRTLAGALGANLLDGEDGPEARTEDGAISLCCAHQDRPLVIW